MQMAPPSSGAYILISGQGLMQGRGQLLRHFWILPQRRQTGKTTANKTLWGVWLQPDATLRGSIITNQCYFNEWKWNKPHAGPLPAPRLPPATSASGKNTEIIKSRSRGSMAAHTNSAPATFRDVYLYPCSAPSANNDGRWERTAAPGSLLRIIVSFHTMFPV